MTSTEALDAPETPRDQRSTPGGRGAARRPDPALMVLGSIGAGGVVSVGLWFFDTPSTINTLAGYLTATGRILGLVGGYLCAVQLLMMARVPWAEHTIGADRLARWHASIGRYTVCALLGHAVFITWGYAAEADVSIVAQVVELAGDSAYQLWAMIGLGLLLTVGVTSMRAIRSRVPYETWYLLHLATYLGVGLAFFHQITSGEQLSDHPLTRRLWTTMYVGVGLTLAWYRVAVPVWQAGRHRLRVAAVVPEGPGVTSVYISGHHLPELRAKPGQFFRWRFLTRAGWWQSHPYSLSETPRSDYLRITVKSIGDSSSATPTLRPGVRVLAEGPFGAFTPARRTSARVLLLAAGIGITPLRALLAGLPARPGELTLVYRASTHADLVLQAEIDAIARARGVTVHYLVGPRGGSADPIGGGTLPDLVPGLRDHDVYVCGPGGFTSGAVSALKAFGVPPRRIHAEQFELEGTGA